jgi:hypothetical protein
MEKESDATQIAKKGRKGKGGKGREREGRRMRYMERSVAAVVVPLARDNPEYQQRTP